MTGPDTRHVWPRDGAYPCEHWSGIVRALDPSLPAGRPCLLAIRGLELDAERAHASRTIVALDDTMVLLPGDGTARTFAAATHPYQLDSRASPDVDGDGRGDVATIVPGRYLMRRLSAVVMHVLRRDGSEGIPCMRDTAHDGHPRTLGTAQAILLHGDWRSGKSSIGCQTAEEANVRAVAAAGPEVDYLLAEVADVLRVAGLSADDVALAEAVLAESLATTVDPRAG